MVRGPQHHWSGARLPNGPRETIQYDDIADPAKGERVPRCLSCGGIGDGEPILEFQLLLMPGGEAAGRYSLCGACYRHANPPRPADPLYVGEGA